jgi:dihydroflavonol-4-reductase
MSAQVMLVTGATGFLCSVVVRALVARGDEVHALARPASDTSVLAGVDVHWHAGNLVDPASVAEVVRAVSDRARERGDRWSLIHGGALISYKTKDHDDAVAVNVEGTRRILEAARVHGVGRVLHVSSVVTVGRSEHGEVLDEAATFNLDDCGVDYVLTKRAGEELALAMAPALDIVVVNPGAIFGPIAFGERSSNTARIVRHVAQGRGPLVAPPGSVAVVGVDDTANGILLALDHGRRGERYLLVESWLRAVELLRLIARTLSRRGPLCAVPPPLWPALVGAAKLWDRIRPMELAPPQGLAMLGCHLRFDASKARHELGWSPRPFAAVLSETIESLRARGLLDVPV